MKLLPCCALAMALTAPCLAEPATARDDTSAWMDVAPGTSRTVYLTNQDRSAGLPVFKVCFRSPAGYGGSLHIAEASKGLAAGYVEPMHSGDCLFASGQRLAVAVNAELPAEKVAEREAAAQRAHAWMEERVAALRALPEPTETDKVLLAEFESRLEAKGNPAEDKSALQRLQSRQRAEELEAKENLTGEEQAELIEAKLQANTITITDTRNGFLIALMPR